MFEKKKKKKDNPRGFPTGVSKTDEERVENQPWRIGDGKTYLATEKLDGTSCTEYLIPRISVTSVPSERPVSSLNAD